MSGVSERVEAGYYVIGNIGGAAPYVCGRDGEILGKSSVSVYSDSYCIGAVVSASGQTVAADSAYDMPFARYSFSYLPSLYLTAEFNDFADIFVSYRHRCLNRFLRPLVPVVYV